MIDPLDRPPAKPITFEPGDTVILCEGFDECSVLRRLCENWSRPPKIGTTQDGKNHAKEIEALANQAPKDRIATIGLVFDAEDDAAAKRDEIAKWLRGAGFQPPSKPLVITTSKIGDTKVKTAYLINPHGQPKGAIESLFVQQMAKAKHWRCIEELVECYKKTQPSKVLEDKLMARTFIAHKNGRNTGLNAAFNARILSCDDKSFEPVRRFLKLLQRASPIERRAKKPSKT